jgi:hypothetical protein
MRVDKGKYPLGLDAQDSYIVEMYGNMNRKKEIVQ